MSRIIAVDLGASTGRVTLATLDNGGIKLDEIHRFPNDPVSVYNTLYWDVLRILHHIKVGITKAKQAGGFDSIGIDTWGTDFALIDAHGRMVDTPVHYRDACADGWQSLFDRIPSEYLYGITGIQNMQVNTIHKVDYFVQERPWDLERARAYLMMPDLFNYFLTGEMKNEYTVASSSQMLDARARVWSKEVLEKLGVNPAIFKEIVMPGTLCGTLLESIKEETGANAAKVYNVASHDTASAVTAIPRQDFNDYIYISSGTWSLIGAEISEPLINNTARLYNFTNEGGTDGRIRFLKNVMGSFLIQESKKQWEKEGRIFTYEELDRLYDSTPEFGSYIDVDDSLFVHVGNMPKRIAEFCKKTGQRIPETEGEFMRVIYDSLALKYRFVIEKTTECTGREYNSVQIIGGGSKSRTLCQLTASATGLPVFAGPAEATTIGNAVIQWIASGDFKSINEARKIVQDTFPQTEYFPAGNMDKEYNKYLSILSMG